MALPASRRRPVSKSGRALPRVPGLAHEQQWWAEGAVVAGVDEVGRGAWAGPVTYAAVVLPTDRRMYKLRDSKTLDAPRREELSARIQDFATGFAVGHVTNDEIDQIGMSAACRLAAKRAVDGLVVRPDVCLIDGNWDFLSGYGTRNVKIVHGDAHSASIAAASIVAKVARDGLLTEACPQFPPYGFSRNKGYPSPEHKAALLTDGPCVLHRHSWAPIAALAQGRLPFDEDWETPDAVVEADEAFGA